MWASGASSGRGLGRGDLAEGICPGPGWWRAWRSEVGPWVALGVAGEPWGRGSRQLESQRLQ